MTIGPDCRDGKCAACDGRAWDDSTDQPAECQHECHRPQRVRLSRSKGWRKPENTVVVARPSKWGNPFRVMPYRSGWFVEIEGRRVSNTRPEKTEIAALAVDLFRDCLAYEWNRYPTVETIRAELAGKNVACWCPLDQPCHADVLRDLANEPKEQ